MFNVLSQPYYGLSLYWLSKGKIQLIATILTKYGSILYGYYFLLPN